MNVHRQFSADEGISYTLLADPKADIIGAFGLINPGVAKTSSWYGIALPAIFVINKSGTITHRFSTENYRQRPDVERVLATLGK